MGRASQINGRFWALMAFVVVCIATTVTFVILLPHLVPKDKNCNDHDVINHEDYIDLSGPSGAKLRINLNTKGTSKKFGKYFYCNSEKRYNTTKNVVCKTYEWKLKQFVNSITDCFDIEPHHWFGGSLLWTQKWPFNGVEHEEAPYVPGDIYQKEYGGVIERFWINSGGFAIFVEDSVPLLVEMKQNQLCLTGSRKSSQYNLRARAEDAPLLAYTICKAADIKTLYQGVRFWALPTEAPERDLFVKPIWSTWAFLKQNITTDSVLAYAKNISNYNLSCSQVEIDDKWSDNYGDHEFDISRFPQPTKLIDDIHDLGYNVTAWVHPFINVDTKAFRTGVAAMGANQSYLVPNSQDPSQPAFTSWWRGTNSTLVDVTNHDGKGTQELRNRLDKLKQLGVDSFKFDGGEANWLPQLGTPSGGRVNPGWYTYDWSLFSYRMDVDKRRQETRIGFRAQALPILVRTMDKDSEWSLDNGLKAVVTSALTHCLLGYNYYMPDMVGGNAYCNDTGLEGYCYPDKELYIRWLQVAAFLPSLQFSIPPWIYGSDVVQITRRLLDVREEQRFKNNMDKALDDAKVGVPIVRPIWWAQVDHFGISDQFFLGDSILVTPILDGNSTTRSVYFPKGKWRLWSTPDDSTKDVDGPKTENWTFQLQSVPAFWLVE